MGQLFRDIFAMRFDIVIPLSSCLVAVALAATLFCIRYFSYRKIKRKFEKLDQENALIKQGAEAAKPSKPPQEKPDTAPVAGAINHILDEAFDG